MGPDVKIVANKRWEADPLVFVLASREARPKELADFRYCQTAPAGPRCRFTCGGSEVEVWCVEDIMDPREHSSSTMEKVRILPQVFQNGRPPAKLVVAFGTAASPDGRTGNGNVVMGSSVFIHDPYETPPDARRHWTHERFDEVIASDAAGLLGALPEQALSEATKRFLQAPARPAETAKISHGDDFLSIGVVNVTDYSHYAWTDAAALRTFREAGDWRLDPASMETTHGVIRLISDAPFVFVSGIANELGKFSEEVAPNAYCQNFVAAHNAAVALAWLLPFLRP